MLDDKNGLISNFKAVDKTNSYIVYWNIARVLATIFNFAHGVLTLSLLVCYSGCLLPPSSLCCHVDTLILLFKIFKCTTLRYARCSLHGIAWIYYDYFFCVEKLLTKQTKKILSFPKGTILILVVSVCARLVSITFCVCFPLSSGGWEITQLYYLCCHMTISANSFL